MNLCLRGGLFGGFNLFFFPFLSPFPFLLTEVSDHSLAEGNKDGYAAAKMTGLVEQRQQSGDKMKAC